MKRWILGGFMMLQVGCASDNGIIYQDGDQLHCPEALMLELRDVTRDVKQRLEGVCPREIVPVPTSTLPPSSGLVK